MKSSISRTAGPVLATVAVGLLAGCGGVSDLTRERVGRSETSVQQAQQTIGNEEAGAVDLQRAQDNLEQARRALQDGNGKQAERYAQLAQLDAELGVAKSQSGRARKAADELLASIQSLRQEADRSSAAPETTSSDTSPPDR